MSARYVNHGTGKPSWADIFSASGSYSMAVVATGSLPEAATVIPAINFCSRVLVAVSIRVGMGVSSLLHRVMELGFAPR